MANRCGTLPRPVPLVGLMGWDKIRWHDDNDVDDDDNHDDDVDVNEN